MAGSKMKTAKFIQITTEDGLTLPGLLYEAEGSKKAAIYLHGNGSSSVFYGDYKMNLFGERLVERGISFFPFNNRGAGWIKKLDKTVNGEKERVLYGMTYELIKECILDIDGAIKYLKGFEARFKGIRCAHLGRGRV